VTVTAVLLPALTLAGTDTDTAGLAAVVAAEAVALPMSNPTSTAARENVNLRDMTLPFREPYERGQRARPVHLGVHDHWPSGTIVMAPSTFVNGMATVLSPKSDT
jgi:hypothetical protein